MKFNIDQLTLNNFLEQAILCIASKNTNSLHEGIYLETKFDNTLTLLTYDLEKGIRIVLPIECIEEGKIVVDAVKFKAIIHSMPNGILSFDVDEKYILTISKDKATFQISANKADEFPLLPSITGDISFTLSQNKLRKLLNKTVFCTSNDDSRPVYMGSLLELNGENLTVVALNSNRLAFGKEYGLCEDKDLVQRIVIPSKSQSVLLKILNETDAPISVEVARKHIIFTIDNIYFIARLLNSEEFMDYNRKVPTSFSTKVLIKKTEFCDSIERASLILDEKNVRNYIKLIVNENFINIKTDTASGKVDDIIDATVDGEQFAIGFNYKLLLELLKMCDSEILEIDFTGANGATIIKNYCEEKKDAEGIYFYLIMPVRMD